MVAMVGHFAVRHALGAGREQGLRIGVEVVDVVFFIPEQNLAG